MRAEIREAAIKGCYNLYVNGEIAVTHETMTVCENIKADIERPLLHNTYSEASEVATRIRNYYR